MPEESTEVRIARLEERLEASDRALDLARVSMENWKAASNEWRKENIDQRNLYPTTDKVISLVASVETRLIVLEKSSSVNSGRHSAYNLMWAVVGSIVGIAFGVILTRLLR